MRFVHTKTLIDKAIFTTWRWRSADVQSYMPDPGAGEASTSKAIFPRLALASAGVQSYLPYFGWRSADLQSYIPDLGAGAASTSKAIFPTLALTNAEVQSYFLDSGAGEALICKAIFWQCRALSYLVASLWHSRTTCIDRSSSWQSYAWFKQNNSCPNQR